MASTFWASPISRAAIGTSNAPGTVISTSRSPVTPASARPATTAACWASTISPPQRVRMTPTRAPESVSAVGKPGMRAVMGGGGARPAPAEGEAAARETTRAPMEGVKVLTPRGDRHAAEVVAGWPTGAGAAATKVRAAILGSVVQRGEGQWGRQWSGSGCREKRGMRTKEGPTVAATYNGVGERRRGVDTGMDGRAGTRARAARQSRPIAWWKDHLACSSTCVVVEVTNTRVKCT